MKTWNNWSIGTRLALSFGMILLCLLAIGGFGLSWLGRLNAELSASLQKRYNTVELTHRTIEHSITNARITFQLFEATDPDDEKKLNLENDAISQEISGQVKEIEQGMSSDKERSLFEVVTENRKAYVSARQKAKALLADKKREQSQAVLAHEVIPALDTYRASWERFIDRQNDAMHQSMKESHDAYAAGRKIAVILMFLTLGLAVLAS